MNAVLHLRIPYDLLERVRILAEENGTTIPIIMRDLLKRYAESNLSVEERLRLLEKAVAALEAKK